MEILSRREAIVALIDDPQTDPVLAQRLAFVLDVRRFATDTLQLPDNRSYTHYADLERDAVLWNVVATPEFSLQPKTWCYPVAGCVSYRGYFRQRRASALADELRAAGWDVQVSPVPAYSTLGRFADPVLNTMLHWNDAQLAATIFHELAHQKIYVPGDTTFNESYATFVGQVGVEWALQAACGAAREPTDDCLRWPDGAQPSLQAWHRTNEVHQAFRALLLGARAELAQLYSQTLPEAQMREAKRLIFQSLRERYRVFNERLADSRYDRWMAQDLNNAHLASFATYEDGVAAFARLFAEVGGDIEAFHHEVSNLARADQRARAAFLQVE